MNNRCSAFRLLCFAMVVLLGRPAAATILTIGTGTASSGTNPLNTCFNYNYSQSIYLASELVSAGATAGTPGYIYSIQFNQTSATSASTWKDWTVYIGHTSSSSFSSATAWTPLSSMSTVFSGTVSPSGTGWYTITLTTPFLWDGTSNIVIAIDENTPGFLCASTWQITNTTGSDYRSLAYYSDATNPDPASPPTAVAPGSFYPNLRLDYGVAIACTGTPVGGNTATSASSLCVGTNVALTVTGATAATGLTYSWESAAAATGPWTTITSATAPTLSTAPPACSTTYYRRKTTCTASSAAAYSVPAAVTATCGIVPPYTEDFESISAVNQLPSCMAATNLGAYTYTYTAATGSYNQFNHTPGGNKFASFRFGADDYFFTPAFDLTAGRTYELSFWYITDGYGGWTSLGAKLGNSPSAAAMTTTLGSVTPANVLYQQFKATFIAASSGTQYIGIYCKASTAPWYLTIDDINLNELPPCSGTPVAGVASANPVRICSSGAPTLSLSGTSAVTGLTYRWESSMTGAPGTFAPISGGTTATFTAPAISTPTYYRAVVKCSLTGDSAASAPLLVPAGTYTPPYAEGFESITAPNQLPACMNATSVAPYVYTYLTGTGSYNQNNHTPGGYRFASFRYGANDYLFTPGIELIAGRTYEFSFWYVTDGLSGWNTLSAKFGNAPTVAGMTSTLGTPVASPSNTSYQQYKVRFVAAASAVQYFGIFCNATTSPWYLTIDDISVKEIPACAGKPVPGVPAASPARICGTGTTLLDLPGLSPALGMSYRWEDSVAGGSWGTGPGRPSFGGFSVPFTTGVVTTPTYFRCKVICGSTSDTSISAPLKVFAGALSTPYSESFEFISAANQLPDCMSATSLAPNVYTAIAPLGTYNRFNHTPGGSKYAYFRYSSDDYLFTPPINIVAGYRYIFSFWYITDGASGWTTLRGNYGTTASAAGMTGTMRAVSAPTNMVYQQYADTFLATSSGAYYFGIYTKASSSPYYLSIDDIEVQVVPCSGVPVAGGIVASLPSGSAICANSSFTLRDTGATSPLSPGISYRWQHSPVGSGVWTDIPYATDTILTADTLAGWDYRLQVSCYGSGISSYSSLFRLHKQPPHPDVSILPADTTSFCFGDTLRLNATAYAGATYTWLLNDIALATTTSNDFGATDPGVYRVRISSPASICPGISEPVVLQAQDPGFLVSLFIPSDSTICDGDSLALKGFSPLTSATLQWRKNNIDIPGATSATYTVTGTGYYRITADNGGGGCKAASRNIFIRVKPTPLAEIRYPSSGLVACSNVGVPLAAVTGEGYVYQWSLNGSPVFGWTDSSVSAKDPGVYTVKIRNSSNCVAYSDGVTVKIFPAPDPVITSSGLVLGLTLSYSGYQWYRNGIAMSGRVSDTLQLSQNGDYTVKVTDANGCDGTAAVFEVSRPDLGIGTAISANTPEVRLYPNPASERVYIETSVPVYVTVKDVTGRILTTQANASEIVLKDYADGIYFFVISDDEHRTIRVEKINKRANH